MKVIANNEGIVIMFSVDNKEERGDTAPEGMTFTNYKEWIKEYGEWKRDKEKAQEIWGTLED